MTIRIGLHHQTRYQYDREVTLSPHVVRLRPAPHCRTPITGYSLKITPEEHFLNWQQDPFGSWQARLVFPKPTREFCITVDVTADLVSVNPFDFFVEPSAEKFPLVYPAELQRDLAPYLVKEDCGTAFAACLADVQGHIPTDITTVDTLVDVNRRIQERIRYLIRLEPGVQTPAETLEKASGSCRDSAWLLVNLLRHLGIASRFVSGYLVQLVADQKALDGPSGTDKDFTDLHAWVEAYVPGAGWIGLDPTSGLLAGEGHLPMACTPYPSDAAPISGSMSYETKDEDDKLETEFTYDMHVDRLKEEPRVTKPYTEEQWAGILSQAEAVDRCLNELDVRLTVGGEPTFTAIENLDAEEWNTGALGDHKWQRACDLFDRLTRAWGTGAVKHIGQGKWYPGEPIPRWALSCFWRKDGVPVWHDPSRMADGSRSLGHSVSDAGRLLAALCSRLEVAATHALPAREDILYHLWKEQQLPVNVDPLKADLKDGIERVRLARLLEQGMGEVVGYALPLTRWGSTWLSGDWRGVKGLRRGRLFLTPGDSPMGFRLPLDALMPSSVGPVWPADPSAIRTQIRHQVPGSEHLGPPPAEPSLTTALCIEPRGGVLRVFLPPMNHAEDWLALVAAIEAAAADTGLPVAIEGYLPPKDPRLVSFSVTPDPGVIEVNIHPASSFAELQERTERLYEEARQARLTTEKFQTDGRHVGTGGGNHITIGGATPGDSPFLRRPEVLRSLIAYWHNHPSLSYLFSGLFIGPTSQAPRADEARTESIYELETALEQIPDGAFTPPWLIDRVLRHCLTDLTGNTHRAEFCIDKLWNPDSPTGRLGLVELRNFEMPPHARMSLAAHLLVRTLIARFWREPYQARLARWGTQLHDRFLIRHFVWQDFTDVCEENGLDPAWFAAQCEFRFPVIGTFGYRDVRVELTTALEPWNVLGEEAAGGATARFVDSSVERLQVRAWGLAPDRWQVRVNGITLPLHPTGTAGEAVCGVRFRAWLPPSCLHPTIGVHSPLAFDIVDTWSAKAVSGATYHVAHPGGRNHTTRPINSLEAEGRRLARFTALGMDPTPVQVFMPTPDQDYPLTLDLRRWR